jgi:hypothetical protein
VTHSVLPGDLVIIGIGFFWPWNYQ